MDTSSLIAAIDGFAARTGRQPGGICHLAVGNGKLYARLKSGGGCTLLTARRLLDWLEANASSSAATLTQVNVPSRGKAVKAAGTVTPVTHQALRCNCADATDASPPATSPASVAT